jgi:hypothetical protein
MMLGNRFGRWLYRLAGLAGLVLLIGLAGHGRAVAQEISYGEFYERLSPYGQWSNHPRYGYVWYPTAIDDSWRPYTRGHWENTEEYGWIWVSEEEWGWAAYHYGRWSFDEGYGWFWVPGTEWGPAWVDWREGDGHIGWAPLPPEARFYDGRWDYGGVDLVAYSYRPAWVFVPAARFLAPRVYSYAVAPSRNVLFINRTAVVTNYARVNNVFVNRSINVQRLEQVTRRPVPVTRVVVANAVPAGRIVGGPGPGGGARTLTVFRPTVTKAPNVTPPRVTNLPAAAPVRTNAPPQGGFGRGQNAPAGPGPRTGTAVTAPGQVNAPPVRANAPVGGGQAPTAQPPRQNDRQIERAERQRIQEQQRAVTQNRAEFDKRTGQTPQGAQPHAPQGRPQEPAVNKRTPHEPNVPAQPAR